MDSEYAIFKKIADATDEELSAYIDTPIYENLLKRREFMRNKVQEIDALNATV